MVAKKANDSDIILLHSLALSHMEIGRRLGIHFSSVARRLKDLNIEKSDNRIAFMDDVFNRLKPTHRKWLVEQLGPDRSIRDFMYSLIVNQYNKENPNE